MGRILYDANDLLNKLMSHLNRTYNSINESISLEARN